MLERRAVVVVTPPAAVVQRLHEPGFTENGEMLHHTPASHPASHAAQVAGRYTGLLGHGAVKAPARGIGKSAERVVDEVGLLHGDHTVTRQPRRVKRSVAFDIGASTIHS